MAADPPRVLTFVDVDVLARADDVSDPVARERARKWLEHLWLKRCGRTSQQVLDEYYVLVTRLGAGLSPGDARAKLRRYQVWHPWQTDARTVETAWGMEARFGLSYWDALAVAAAAQSGCHYLLTQSLPHRTAFDQVTTLRPQHCLPSEIHDV